MRVEARIRRRRTKVYEAALMFGYINSMVGIILALMGIPHGLAPLIIGASAWSFAIKYAGRFGLE